MPGDVLWYKVSMQNFDKFVDYFVHRTDRNSKMHGQVVHCRVSP